MRLGLLLRYDGERGGPRMDLVLEAERLGYTSVWAGESYGTDAVTPIAWVLARTERIQAGTGIIQMSARTPTCAAMTCGPIPAGPGSPPWPWASACCHCCHSSCSPGTTTSGR